MVKNNNRNIARYSSGFTLVELLIVLAVIAVLAVLLLPRISSFLNKQKSNQLATIAMNIEQADNAYYKDCGTYPSNSAINALWNKNIASVAGNNRDSISASNCWNGPYMQALPPNITTGAQGYFTSPFGNNSICNLYSDDNVDLLNDGVNHEMVLGCTNIPTQAVTYLEEKMNGGTQNSGMVQTNCSGSTCTVTFILEEN